MSTDWRSRPGRCARIRAIEGEVRLLGNHAAAAIWRLLPRFHFQDGDLHAREAGAAIGQQAYEWAELYWEPFGEIADTVVELRRAGQLSPGAFRQLARLVDGATRAFAAGRTVKACRLLEDLGAGVRPLAAAQLGRQHAWATDARCG